MSTNTKQRLQQQYDELAILTAALRAELSASQAREAESREKLKVVTNLHAIEQDMRIAEEKLRRAAEASIKASQEQEPEFVDFEVYGYASDNARAESWCKETDWRVSEFLSIIGDNWEQNSTIRNVVFHHYAAPVTPPEIAELQRENAELRKLLEESKVPEGWKLVRDYHPDGCPQEFVDWFVKNLPDGTIIGNSYWWPNRIYKAMLSAQPKEPKQ